MKRSILVQLIAAIAGPALLVGAVFLATNNLLVRKAKASAYVATFDDQNSPTLSSGAATITDRRGIVWEYSGAADYANGHITLGHGGYFGIKSTSPYGLKGIEYVTVDYTEETNAELWLLKSIDGIDWNECLILEDGTPTEYANDWQYIRFYNYATDLTTSIDIDTVEIGYSCISTGNASEDVDSAFASNVVDPSGTSATAETTTVCPRGNSQESIRFTKTGTGETYAYINLNRTYLLEEVKTSKIEFDLHKSATWKPSVGLYYNGTRLGSEISNKSNCYLVSDADTDWWHIEVYVVAIAPTVSDAARGDKPVAVNSPINRVKIGVGNGIIDNLRFDSTPSTSLGLFNRTTTCEIGGDYWVKIAWSGSLQECTYTFTDPTIAEQHPIGISPFYIRGLAAGSTGVIPRMVLGYNRQVVQMNTAISTVSVS